MRNIIVCAPAPFGTLCIPCGADDDDVSTESIHDVLAIRLSRSVLRDTVIDTSGPTSQSSSQDVYVRLKCRFLGGKGGFGSQLRAAGGKRKKQNEMNRTAMADVSGRKLRTLQRAEQLVSQLATLPESRAAERQGKREALLAIVGAQSAQRTRVLFDDEAYFGTAEQLLLDLKHAMMQVDDSNSDQEEDEEEASASASRKDTRGQKVPESVSVGPRKIQGWDDDDDEEDENEGIKEQGSEAETQSSGKGKQKVAIARTTDAHLRKRVKAR